MVFEGGKYFTELYRSVVALTSFIVLALVCPAAASGQVPGPVHGGPPLLTPQWNPDFLQGYIDALAQLQSDGVYDPTNPHAQIWVIDIIITPDDPNQAVSQFKQYPGAPPMLYEFFWCINIPHNKLCVQLGLPPGPPPPYPGGGTTPPAPAPTTGGTALFKLMLYNIIRHEFEDHCGVGPDLGGYPQGPIVGPDGKIPPAEVPAYNCEHLKQVADDVTALCAAFCVEYCKVPPGDVDYGAFCKWWKVEVKAIKDAAAKNPTCTGINPGALGSCVCTCPGDPPTLKTLCQ